MRTKERILRAALRLFSERGYGSVSVSDIADAVEIRAPSLYKHFRGKKDIFDSCVALFSERMRKERSRLGVPGSGCPAFSYDSVTEEELAAAATGLFRFYLTDEVASGLRRMLILERYADPELDRLYTGVFITGAVDYEEGIFADLMGRGVIRGDDPHMAALHFYSPIFYLLQKYDTRPDNIEEAQVEVARAVHSFWTLYGMDK